MTDGVYAGMRHALYSGLFFVVFGEGIVHWPMIVSVIAFPVIVIVNTLLAKEERPDARSAGEGLAGERARAHLDQQLRSGRMNARQRRPAQREPGARALPRTTKVQRCMHPRALARRPCPRELPMADP